MVPLMLWKTSAYFSNGILSAGLASSTAPMLVHSSLFSSSPRCVGPAYNSRDLVSAIVVVFDCYLPIIVRFLQCSFSFGMVKATF